MSVIPEKVWGGVPTENPDPTTTPGQKGREPDRPNVRHVNDTHTTPPNAVDRVLTLGPVSPKFHPRFYPPSPRNAGVT